jgi:dihydroxyacetone synthase
MKIKPSQAVDHDVQLVLNTIRCLAADLCQQYKGGHPGTVMGAAAIAVALWKNHLRFNPLNPDWFARDRFVLSAGHACLLQYTLLHLTGYEAWTMDQIRLYHANTATDSMAAGHPEIEFPGVEVTTGPLGQGISNAVGLAIAGKQLAATYNKDDLDIIGQRIWCFTGDGCLQEGVGQESISLAGHLGLDNLVLIYDNNSVTVDGNIDSCFTDDTSAKLQATGWHVIDVYDATNDVKAISDAMEQAKYVVGKPVLINVRTTIGFASRKANTGAVHGAALGEEEVDYVKTQLGFDPAKHFYIPQKAYDYFADCKQKGQELEAEWNDAMAKYKQRYPEEEAELQRRIQGKLADNIESLFAKLPTKDKLPQSPQPTRKASGIALNAIVPTNKSFVAGSADLMESTFVNFDGQVDFQKPSSGLGDYTGRQIRYGIREFAMAGIANGLAAYQKGMFLPIISTFFMFFLYAAPAIRMSALMKIRFIGIATHDSIGIGEDGPTHQPVGLAALFRAMPNINLIRPADAEEVMGAWLLALKEEDTPSILALSRQAVPLLPGSSRDKVALGAYPVVGGDIAKPDLVLVATGAEVSRAIETADILSKKGMAVRVVSMPSQQHFDQQPISYRRSVLPADTVIVAIEAWASFGWPRYAHASLSMQTFGHSAPQAVLYEHFGFSPSNMAQKISAYVDERKASGNKFEIGDFKELLLGFAH